MIKKILLYAGLSKNDFESIAGQMREDNRQGLCLYTLLAVATMLIMLFASLFEPSLVKNRLLYCIIAVLCGVLHAAGRRVKGSVAIYTAVYVFVSAVFLFGILMGTVLDPGHLSVIYPVLLFAAPLLFTDRPARMGVSVLASVIVYFVMAHFTQTVQMQIYNATNIVPFTALSILISAYMMTVKVKGYSLENKNRHLMSAMSMTDPREKQEGRANIQRLVELMQVIMTFHSDESLIHCKRVRQYTSVMCNAYNRRHRDSPISPEKIELICIGAQLHDVGKIYIPDEILHKKTPLTAEEKQTVRQHTVVGASLIDYITKICSLDSPILHNIVLYHHERIDGEGYPEHLKGNDIPLEAQLVGVAEVYDVLTEKNYTRAVSHDDAVKMICDGKCGSFSEDILGCFTSAAGEFAMLNENKDSRLDLLGNAIVNRNAGYWRIKRAFDLIASIGALIVLSPLLALIALWIKIDDPKSPVIFKQQRVGRHKKLFMMYKFRTMVPNAEELLKKMQEQNEKDGPVFKIKKDPRITKPGRFLRKTSLDELPQLWNIVKGDMSIVGPRPPLPSEVEKYSTYHEMRLSVTPGLTCLWQAHDSRDDVKFEDWMDMDVAYIGTRSAATDMKIIMKTIGVVLKGGGN